jgi:hypothetical protein
MALIKFMQLEKSVYDATFQIHLYKYIKYVDKFQ